MTAFAKRAESLFALWRLTVTPDEHGTRASELYAAFATFTERGSLTPDEIPTETAFGRRLTAEGFPPAHRADGNWRPLRCLAVTEPAPPFSQVNPSEPLPPAVGLAGSLEESDDSDVVPHARVHPHRTHAQPPDSTGTEIPPQTRQPVMVTHPSKPAWAKRWQAKLDAAPTPKDRAAEAWSLVLAVAAQCKWPPSEAAFTEVGNTLVELANAMWPPKPAPPQREHPPRPTPTSVPIFEDRADGREGRFLYFIDPGEDA